MLLPWIIRLMYGTHTMLQFPERKPCRFVEVKIHPLIYHGINCWGLQLSSSGACLLSWVISIITHRILFGRWRVCKQCLSKSTVSFNTIFRNYKYVTVKEHWQNFLLKLIPGCSLGLKRIPENLWRILPPIPWGVK